MSYVIQDIQIQATEDWNNLSNLFMLPRGASVGRKQINCSTLLQSPHDAEKFGYIKVQIRHNFSSTTAL
jgi:hypothetical protein